MVHCTECRTWIRYGCVGNGGQHRGLMKYGATQGIQGCVEDESIVALQGMESHARDEWSVSPLGMESCVRIKSCAEERCRGTVAL